MASERNVSADGCENEKLSFAPLNIIKSYSWLCWCWCLQLNAYRGVLRLVAQQFGTDQLRRLDPILVALTYQIEETPHGKLVRENAFAQVERFLIIAHGGCLIGILRDELFSAHKLSFTRRCKWWTKWGLENFTSVSMKKHEDDDSGQQTSRLQEKQMKILAYKENFLVKNMRA